MNLNRRGFLGGLIAALTVPAIVKIDGLAAITPELITPELVIPDYLWMARFDIFQHMFTVNAMPRPAALSGLVGGSFRALPDELCRTLTDKYGHLCRPDAELELSLTEEQMMLPRFGSLVPQTRRGWYGAPRLPSLSAGRTIQRAIDERTGNVGT